MKRVSIIILLALTGCGRSVPQVCAAFHPTAPYRSPQVQARDRELLEINGEYAAFNEGLLCGGLR